MIRHSVHLTNIIVFYLQLHFFSQLADDDFSQVFILPDRSSGQNYIILPSMLLEPVYSYEQTIVFVF